jgi:hypothetical protein
MMLTGKKKNPQNKKPFDAKSSLTYDYEGKPVKFNKAKISANAGIEKSVKPDLAVGGPKTKGFWDFAKKA